LSRYFETPKPPLCHVCGGAKFARRAIDVITFLAKIQHQKPSPANAIPTNLFPFPTGKMSSIPHKEIHAAATNPSEPGFPTTGKPAPDDQDAWSAPNNPATKNPTEEHPEWEGKTLDGRGAGTTGGRSKNEMHSLPKREGSGESVGAGDRSGGTEKVEKHLSRKEWRKQEGQVGQGGQEAPAGQSNLS
jgi:hypothetical protein